MKGFWFLVQVEVERALVYGGLTSQEGPRNNFLLNTTFLSLNNNLWESNTNWNKWASSPLIDVF